MFASVEREIFTPVERKRLARHGDEQLFERRVPVLARERFGIAFEKYSSFREEQHAVAHLLDLVHVVRSPEHAARAFGGAFAYLLAYVAGGRRVERGGRLVEQKELRAVDHRLGERDARLLARREHAALRVAEAHEVELFEEFTDARVQALHAVEHPEEAQVLRDGEVAGERCIDGGEVRTRERARAPPREVNTFDENRTRRRFEHAEQHVDGRRLARAVRAEQTDDLVARDVERDAVNRDQRAVLFAQAAHHEHVCRTHLCLLFVLGAPRGRLIQLDGHEQSPRTDIKPAGRAVEIDYGQWRLGEGSEERR